MEEAVCFGADGEGAVADVVGFGLRIFYVHAKLGLW
jgi:hypothetical protein